MVSRHGAKLSCTDPHRAVQVVWGQQAQIKCCLRIICLQERGEKVGDIVGYSVRLDRRASQNTRLMFCTTGKGWAECGQASSAAPIGRLLPLVLRHPVTRSSSHPSCKSHRTSDGRGS